MRRPDFLTWGGFKVLVVYEAMNDVNKHAIVNETYDELCLWRGDWEDLSFLMAASEKITRLSILAYKCDLNSIACLKKLRYLRLEDSVEPMPDCELFDFSNFCELEECHLTWRKYYSLNFLDCPRLRSLFIWKYPHPTLSDIKRAKNLQVLSLNQSSLISLSGIEYLSCLEELQLSNLAKLENISELELLHSIISFSVEKCPKLFNISSLASLEKLQYFSYSSKSPLPNLSLLKSMPALREFIFNCEILEQDFLPVFQLKELKLGRFILLKGFTATDDELIEMAHQVGKKLELEVLRRGRKEQTVTFIFSES